MITHYIFLNSRLGKDQALENYVIEEISNDKNLELKGLCHTFGKYDMILEISSKDKEHINEFGYKLKNSIELVNDKMTVVKMQ